MPHLTARGQALRVSSEEVEYYERVAATEAKNVERSPLYRHVMRLVAASDDQVRSFPAPADLWLDALFDGAAQWDCYRHLAPLAGKRIVQFGGKGLHAVKLLLAGAAETCIVTPVDGEVRFAEALAERAGVADRLRTSVSVTEDMPFEEGVFDGAISAGCVHHMATELAFPEIARVLRSGGRFAAYEPWQAPLYGIGTKIVGRREDHDYCTPLAPDTLRPIFDSFPNVSIVHHGTLSRYPLLAAHKLGARPSLSFMLAATSLDDRICSLLRLRRWGSSVAVLATR